MIFSKWMRTKILCAASILAAILMLLATDSRPAWAVIIASGNGQTGVDPNNPNTANVGLSSTLQASVTYLGNDWAITANHVTTSGQVVIGGTDYSINQTVQLTNPQDNSLADLKLIHIVTGGANPAPPALNSLQIDSSSPAANTLLEMVGNGGDLYLNGSTPQQYYWNVTAGPTWTQTYATMADPNPGDASGYEVLGSHSVRYGENNVFSTSGSLPTSDGSSWTVTSYTTQFNNSVYTGGPVNPDEAQATTGDSGGAVFTQIGGQWYLSGIMVAEGTYQNQPTNVTPTVSNGVNTAVFGDQTYIADLSVYRSEILAVVPEPNSLVLGALGLLGLLVAAHKVRRGT
jgi:hypothetical protein